MHDNVYLQDEIQRGIILSIDGDLAKVRVAANAECDNCGQCNVVHMEIIAYNAVNAKIGEKIRFTMVHDSMNKIAFMIFILPLIFIFLGIYAGSSFASAFNFSSTAVSIVGGLLFLMIAIFIIYSYDKKYRLNKSNFPQVIEVIK